MQQNTQEQNPTQAASVEQYSPRKYSRQETTRTTIKLFGVVGGILAAIWVLESLLNG